MIPHPFPPVPAHCPSTFKYFLSVCVHILREEQIKNTKTIPRDYTCDTGGVYRRLRHRKNAGKQFKHENFLRCWFLQTPGEEIAKRGKKRCSFPGDR